MDLPDQSSVPVDIQLLIDESRISCTSAMLLCLDREQRLVYVLGEIFGVTDAVGAELLETSRDNFRQKLARARRDLHSFMQDRCGLVNTANPCRCARKTQAFMAAGYVDPANLLFAKPHLSPAGRAAPHAWSSARMSDAEEVIALERAALDRWGRGDPQGYLEIMAPEMTYFDPTQDTEPDGSEQPFLRWNSTEVYSRTGGRWRIVHSHWSYVKPELKQPLTELL